jgi:hypothetical protein
MCHHPTTNDGLNQKSVVNRSADILSERSSGAFAPLGAGKLILVFFTLINITLGAVQLDSPGNTGNILVLQMTSVEQGDVQTIDWFAPQSEIASLPEWHIDDDSFNSFTIKQAVNAVLELLKKQFPTVHEWQLQSATLCKIVNGGHFVPVIKNKYAYRVHILPVLDSDLQLIKDIGSEYLLDQVILTNGIIIKGKKSSKKLQYEVAPVFKPKS